jgi:2-oxoisovalerate dehydrogenase E1 component alpha subunit
MSDKDPDLRRNAPKLALHVPEPLFRPGDTPDFPTLPRQPLTRIP